MLRLRSTTDPAWVALALDALDDVLVDHAHCEHKAAVMALAFISKYPDDPTLVTRLAALAAEEAEHLERVSRLCHERGLRLGHPAADPYAKGLLAHVRTDRLGHRTDRLLVCALIEARSCERLRLLAEGLAARASAGDDGLAAFYDELWRVEAGHHALFVDLAIGALIRFGDRAPEAARDEVKARLDELAAAEAEVLASLPLRPAIH